MNRNVKIAKELVKLAKMMISKNQYDKEKACDLADWITSKFNELELVMPDDYQDDSCRALSKTTNGYVEIAVENNSFDDEQTIYFNVIPYDKKADEYLDGYATHYDSEEEFKRECLSHVKEII